MSKTIFSSICSIDIGQPFTAVLVLTNIDAVLKNGLRFEDGKIDFTNAQFDPLPDELAQDVSNALVIGVDRLRANVQEAVTEQPKLREKIKKLGLKL